MAGSKKAAGVQKLFKPSSLGFRRRLEHPKPNSHARILKNTPSLDLAAPPVATAFLVDGVVLPRFGRLDVRMVVDVERAPYLGHASRLSAASYNTRVPPVNSPYPPCHQTLVKMQAPSPQNGTEV
jgi:hypothetical protein